MTADEIIALARTQVGVSEDPPGSNNIVYNTEYYGGPSNLPWCVVFIWWLFKHAGASYLFCGGNKTAWCNYVRDWAQAHGQWVTEDYRPGDIVLYNWNSDDELDHIGLVVEAHGNSLTTIEGNEGDKVSVCARGGLTVTGAYRPKYSSGSAPAAPSEPAAPTYEDPDSPGTYTVKSGDMLGLIALAHGTTIAELARINNIPDPNRIYPGQVLILPGHEAPAEPEPEPEPVDDEAARITALARDVIAGKYGNGLTRVLKLGKDYKSVQAEVNRLLAEA